VHGFLKILALPAPRADLRKNLRKAAMKNKMMFPVIFALLSLASAASRAEEATTAQPAPSATPVINVDRNVDENWYWGINIGGATRKYTSAAQEAYFNSLSALPTTDHANVALEFYFMWPLEGHRTALGVGFDATSDSYHQDSTDTQRALTNSILAFTAHHYFTSHIGDGFFGRFDIGPASGRFTQKVGGTDLGSTTYRGWGFRVGGGYSIPLSPETRLPLTVQFESMKLASNRSSRSLIFTVGLLF
jgi:hypothetical protein